MLDGGELDELIQFALAADMRVWMPEWAEEKGGLNEEDIHYILESYSILELYATKEMRENYNLAAHFDANQDGLVDKTEVIKLIKWFVRAVWVGSNQAESAIRTSLRGLLSHVMKSDRNGDELLTKDEASDGFTALTVKLDWHLSSNMNAYYEDYDFNNNGVLDKFELTEFMKRYVRDVY